MRSLVSRHIHRRLGAVLKVRLGEVPVIALQGPRSVGKSTMLREIAHEHRVGVIDLDDPGVQDAVRANPDEYVDQPAPVCIDEYQKLPLVLDAIKARLNRDTRVGGFVLTGSTRYDALPRAAQSLTGRMHILTVLPLSQGECLEHRETFLEDMLRDTGEAVAGAVKATARAESPGTDRNEYIDRVSAGGFPLALTATNVAARNRWFDDYVSLVLDRDVLELSRVRQRDQLPRLLSRLAGQTAQVLNVANAAVAVGMDPTTAENYVSLLETVFLISRLPAWGVTVRARVSNKPKVHVVDSGVAARLLRMTPSRMATMDPAALTEFGHLLETFVVNELLKQSSWLDGIATVGHWRTHDGDEVDLVVERDDGRIVAFEVKAGSRVPGEALKPLRKLRDAIGSRFIAGVALCTGERAYTFEDRIHVMPIDRLWT